MDYKLIALDMDGTLLDSNHRVSSRTYRALRLAEEKGVSVVLATGRLYKSAKYYVEKLGLKNPIISSNGALVHDIDGSVLYENLLSYNGLKDSLRIIEDHGIYYHLYTTDSVYSKTIKMDMLRKFYSDFQGRLLIKAEKFKSYDEILGLKFNKIITISDKNEELVALKKDLDRLEEIEVTSSLANNLEIMNRNVSKKTAIEYLAKRLGIEPMEIVTIGDNANDLSMIEYAGLGIAMGNAISKLRSAADYVTDTNNNDGVAKAIEKFIL